VTSHARKESVPCQMTNKEEKIVVIWNFKLSVKSVKKPIPTTSKGIQYHLGGTRKNNLVISV
jgi:hypothetical protein